MFAKTIIDSDAFLDMPMSTQCLYFHLAMRADDDGFLNNPKKVQRMIGASDDDLKVLLGKKFLIAFESGVVVIKHWKIHNYIRNDRYKPTVYEEEKAQLKEKENGSYTLGIPDGIPDGYRLDTQDRLELGKDRVGKGITPSKEGVCRAKDAQRIVNAWNSLGLQQVQKVLPDSKRGQMLRARVNEYGVDAVLQAIEKVRVSDFLKGGGSKEFIITFDWFVKPNNFPKVLEGNYDNRGGQKAQVTANPFLRDAMKGHDDEEE